MLSEKTRDALTGIRMNIEAARAFTEGMSFLEFTQDLKTFYAVTRALEIISEASRRLPDDLKARHPHMPWRAIRDAGNLYRHRYDNVAASLVWRTAREDLHDLLEVAVAELNAEDTGA